MKKGGCVYHGGDVDVCDGVPLWGREEGAEEGEREGAAEVEEGVGVYDWKGFGVSVCLVIRWCCGWDMGLDVQATAAEEKAVGSVCVS